MFESMSNESDRCLNHFLRFLYYPIYFEVYGTMGRKTKKKLIEAKKKSRINTINDIIKK